MRGVAMSRGILIGMGGRRQGLAHSRVEPDGESSSVGTRLAGNSKYHCSQLRLFMVDS